ncbi:MAG: hypothetical protein C0606_04235 [Hyphomicrobiales bacterium]|nr:MAG: hypothetical protein C0606_04235 [Hyphomicrobiales bacterium]
MRWVLIIAICGLAAGGLYVLLEGLPLTNHPSISNETSDSADPGEIGGVESAKSPSSTPAGEAETLRQKAAEILSNPSQNDSSPQQRAEEKDGEKRLPEGLPVTSTVRDVTPRSMTPGPTVEGPLERIPGRQPPPLPPRMRLYHRVLVVDASTIKSGRITIRLAGIDAPSTDTTCTDRSGREWRCGIAARTALRRLIRARSIGCRSKPIEAPATVTLACTVGRTDLSAWLLKWGWARLAEGEADDTLVKAEASAREAGRGLWR